MTRILNKVDFKKTVHNYCHTMKLSMVSHSLP